jgi:hypothetical protein
MNAVATHPTHTPWTAGRDALDYWLDVGQPWVLFLHMLGERARGFNLHRPRSEEAGQRLTLAGFKQWVREQFLVLLLDERRAVEAIPTMLGRDPGLAQRLRPHLRNLIDIVGVKSGTGEERLQENEAIFDSLPRDRTNRAQSPTARDGSACGWRASGQGRDTRLNVMMR